VNIDSPGITLFADVNKTAYPPEFGLFVRNENMYPIRLPIYDALEYTWSENSTSKTIIYIEWVVSHFDIPAMSTESIYQPFSFMGTEECPIYFTLYGRTVRYPPVE
jgi:hypothetical protein